MRSKKPNPPPPPDVNIHQPNTINIRGNKPDVQNINRTNKSLYPTPPVVKLGRTLPFIIDEIVKKKLEETLRNANMEEIYTIEYDGMSLSGFSPKGKPIWMLDDSEAVWFNQKELDITLSILDLFLDSNKLNKVRVD